MTTSPRLQHRHQDLLDIGQEAFAIDGAFEDTGLIDAVATQGGEEGDGLPVAMRHLGLEPLATRPQPRTGPCSSALGFIDEDQAPSNTSVLCECAVRCRSKAWIGSPARPSAAISDPPRCLGAAARYLMIIVGNQ